MSIEMKWGTPPKKEEKKGDWIKLDEKTLGYDPTEFGLPKNFEGFMANYIVEKFKGGLCIVKNGDSYQALNLDEALHDLGLNVGDNVQLVVHEGRIIEARNKKLNSVANLKTRQDKRDKQDEEARKKHGW